MKLSVQVGEYAFKSLFYFIFIALNSYLQLQFMATIAIYVDAFN